MDDDHRDPESERRQLQLRLESYRLLVRLGFRAAREEVKRIEKELERMKNDTGL